jgi:hypothetical protein
VMQAISAPLRDLPELAGIQFGFNA